MLGHSLWQSQFGADAQILGKSIPLSGNMYTVIGVMPASFATPTINTEAWTPVHVSNPARRTFAEFIFCEVTVASLPASALNKRAPKCRSLITILQLNIQPTIRTAPQSCLPLYERIVGESRRSLYVLFAAVSFVLLIACANFANLLLARAAEREREFVIRGALGAGRWRLIRQLLTESVLVSLAGGVLAVGLAYWGTNLLVAFKPDNLPRLAEIGVDARVLAFTLGVSTIDRGGFRFVAGLDGCANGIGESLKEGGRSCDGGKCTAKTTKYIRRR